MKKIKKIVPDQGRQFVLTMKQTQKILFGIKGGLSSTLKFIILPVWLYNS